MSEWTFRALGYGGLALVALVSLAEDQRAALWLLLTFAVSWPWAWRRWIRRALSPGRRPLIWQAAHGLECLLLVGVVSLARLDLWLVLGTALVALTGVAALGGPSLLLTCAAATALAVIAAGGFDPRLEPVAVAGGLLVASFLLGLSLESFARVRTVAMERRRMASEKDHLRDLAAHLARYLPQGLDTDAGSEVRLPEERFVSVAFIDVVGFVELVGSRPVAELVDVLNDFMAAVNRLTEERGGTVGKWLGDGALVYFLETANMTRPQAAAACAGLCLELVDTLAELTFGWRRRGLTANLTTRAGISSGYCALGDWGGDQRLDYTLIGNPVNLASRLEAEAAESGILICAATAALLEEGGIVAERIGPARRLTVRGFGPCRVHELLPSANVRAFPQSGTFPAWTRSSSEPAAPSRPTTPPSG